MKKVCLYLLGASMLLVGCKDSPFFKTESPSAMDATVFTIPSQTEQVIAGIYAMMGEQNSYRTRLGGPWVSPGTDCESYVPTAPDYAVYTMTKVGNGDLTSKDKHPWIYLTQAIERANVCIQGIEKYSDLSKTEFQYLYGEALTLRAWLHYEMTKYWGDVPAMFTPLDVENEASIYPSKVDRNVIYEQLRKDLKTAAANMPNSIDCPGRAKNNVERVNREFALGLLARVDLVYAGKAIRPNTIQPGSGYQTKVWNVKDAGKRQELYNEAMWACDEIIKADGAGKLNKSFEDVFKNICANVTDYSKAETLWEIPFANGIRGQFLNRMGAYNHSSAKGHLINFYKSNGKLVAPTQYVFSFDPKDKRRWVTLEPAIWQYDSEKAGKIPGAPASGSFLYQSPQKINKFYMAKFRSEWMNYTITGDEDGLNIPIMRYSDVLLMYAEAAIGGIGGDVPAYSGSISGLQAFNMVHQRAGLDAVDTYTMDDIMNERAWEFAGEFIRKWDLMRWGVFSEKLMAAQKDYENFFNVDGDGNIDFTGTPYEGKLGIDIYYKYENVPSFDVNGVAAYKISEMWGLNFGENNPPEGYISSSENGGWYKADAYTSNSASICKSSNNRIYGDDMTADQIEARQYWPLFDCITSSNHNLWNDYNY